jgi:hypothetical protein
LASRLLSKTKYLHGLRCPLLLWTQANDAAKIPPVSTITQHRFDEGNMVGHFAKNLFPDGIDIPTDNFFGNIQQTKRLLKARKPLFEAGTLCGRLYARPDILNPVNDDAWDIYEVKSSTEARETNFHDVAFQKHVYQQAGIKIKHCFLIYIDSNYVKYGEIDPNELFYMEDISAAVEEATAGLEERINEMFAVMGSKETPSVPIGSHCLSPWDCDLKPVCWGSLPENSVFELTGNKTKQLLLFEKGVISINDIPEEEPLSPKQAIQKECIATGRTHIDKSEICRFTSQVIYPAYFLEIKTASPAIPIYDGTRPYQNIPFQFSLHIVEGPGLAPVHYSFLAEGANDPRIRFLEEMSKRLGCHGSIIVDDAQFNTTVLQELAQAFPRYTGWAQDIIARLADLKAPFSNFHYYHPSQKGEATLEKALSVITDAGAKDGLSDDKRLAGITFINIVRGRFTAGEADIARKELINSCEQETIDMIKLFRKLLEICTEDQTL